MKRWRGTLVAVIAVCAFAVPVRAADEPVRVLLNVSYAPDAGEFALKTSPLVLDWYPKINELLYGPDHKLPFNIVIVSFQHGLNNYAALTSGNVIRISADVLRNRHDSYEGMVIHELTHVVQHYPQGQGDAGWLVEGIADYVRHEAYEKDIKPTMQIDAQGHAHGYTEAEPYFYGLEQNHVDLRDKGYLKTYTVAANFLFWLETHKDKQIVHELNAALAQGKYTPDMFSQLCGQPLDELWAAFVTESQAATH